MRTKIFLTALVFKPLVGNVGLILPKIFRRKCKMHLCDFPERCKDRKTLKALEIK